MRNKINHLKLWKVICVMLACAMTLCSCVSDEKVAEKFINKVETLQNEEMPTNEEVDTLIEQFNKMTESQQELAKNYNNILLNMDKIDFTALNNIQTSINEYFETHDSKDDLDYSLLQEIVNKYKRCTDAEKKYIKNYENIEELITLTDYEMASVEAIDFLKQMLKDENSLIVDNIRVKKSSKTYYVTIDYSAKNGFGGTSKDTSCIDVMYKENEQKYEVGLMSLCLLTGGFEESSNITLSYYLTNSSPEVKVDVDKVINYIKYFY